MFKVTQPYGDNLNHWIPVCMSNAVTHNHYDGSYGLILIHQIKTNLKTHLLSSNTITASFYLCCIIFLTFSNKSHNMKALIILSHSWLPFFLLIYMEEMNFCEALWPFWSIFARKNSQFEENSFVMKHLQNYPWPI